MLTPIEVIYQSLGIRQKLQDQKLRVLYLREVWGLEQTVIGKLENISQAKVSKVLKEGNQGYSQEAINNLFTLQFDIEEIKYLQRIPSNTIGDAQLISFVNNILGLSIQHPFYTSLSYKKAVRIVALHSLGVRQKTLAKIFGISHGGVSKIIRRNLKPHENVNLSLFRSDWNSTMIRFTTHIPRYSIKFQLAGGQNQ